VEKHAAADPLLSVGIGGVLLVSRQAVCAGLLKARLNLGPMRVPFGVG
jgi:hypothetical protein